RGEATHEPEIDHTEDRRVGGAHEDEVPRVRVGVEEAVLEDRLDDQVERRLADALAAEAALDRGVDLVSLEVLEGEHPPRRRLAIDERKADLRAAGEVLGELAG